VRGHYLLRYAEPKTAVRPQSDTEPETEQQTDQTTAAAKGRSQYRSPLRRSQFPRAADVAKL